MDAECDNELKDVALCYQALGAEICSTPAQLENLYRSLTLEYKKKAVSLDPAIREAARVNLEQVMALYDKITRSITYRAMQKEHLKRNAEAGPIKVARSPKVTVRVHCTCCNGLIPKGLRTCPICKSPMYSAMERKIRAHLAPKKLALYFVIVSTLSLAVLVVRNPERFSTQAFGDLLKIKQNYQAALDMSVPSAGVSAGPLLPVPLPPSAAHPTGVMRGDHEFTIAEHGRLSGFRPDC